MVLTIILVVGLWIMPILITRMMGKSVGMQNAWLWGFFLGWLGVFIVAGKSAGATKRAMKKAGLHTDIPGAARDAALLKQRMLGEIEDGKPCPACAETVQAAAKVCRYCGHTFEIVDSPV